ADDLGIGGGFLAGAKVELRQAHRDGFRRGDRHSAMRRASTNPPPSVAVAVDFDALAWVLVDALVLSTGIPSGGRLLGDLQHAVGIVPAVERRAGIRSRCRRGVFGT